MRLHLADSSGATALCCGNVTKETVTTDVDNFLKSKFRCHDCEMDFLGFSMAEGLKAKESA